MARAAIAYAAMTIVAMVAAIVRASDPDPIQDVCVADLSHKMVTVNGFPCKNSSLVTDQDFVFSGLRLGAPNTGTPYRAASVYGTVRQYPGLNTQGISIVRHDYEPGGIIPAHSHPRASEVLYVLEGTLYAGFVTGAAKLFAKNITAGDAIVTPRGLMHFQLNVGPGPASAIAFHNSQFPGQQIIGESLFQPDIVDDIFTVSFFLTKAEVDHLQSVFLNLPL